MIPDEEIARNAHLFMQADRRLPEEMRAGNGLNLLLPDEAGHAVKYSAFLHPSWSRAIYACSKDSSPSACIRINGGEVSVLTRSQIGISQKSFSALSLCEIRTCIRDVAATQILHLAGEDMARIEKLCLESGIELIQAEQEDTLPAAVDFEPIPAGDDEARFDFLVAENEFGRTLYGGQFVRIGMNRATGRVDIYHGETGSKIGDGGFFEAIIETEQSRHGLSGAEISEMDGYVGEVECSVRGKDGSGRHLRHSYLNMPMRFASTISRLGRPSLDSLVP